MIVTVFEIERGSLGSGAWAVAFRLASAHAPPPPTVQVFSASDSASAEGIDNLFWFFNVSKSPS